MPADKESGDTGREGRSVTMTTAATTTATVTTAGGATAAKDDTIIEYEPGFRLVEQHNIISVSGWGGATL